ncbi:MAG: hypothetical protein ACREL5_08725, partial [Gemmatimonadales bacterium]
APPDTPIARLEMPPVLDEISGLALIDRDHLLTHNDDEGRVFDIAFRTGELVHRFQLGSPPVAGDFEAITTVGDTVFLLTSDGVLYQFRQGADGESVPYVEHDTGLGDECEFEGMVYERRSESLLLACKTMYDKALRDSVVVFRMPLAPPLQHGTTNDAGIDHLAVASAAIVGSHNWKGVHPSGIAIDPFTGDYVLVAAREQAIFELTPDGRVVFSRSLPEGHPQAEGVAITNDSILIISDEAKGIPAYITLYRWR